jgi:hypothetical protein
MIAPRFAVRRAKSWRGQAPYIVLRDGQTYRRTTTFIAALMIAENLRQRWCLQRFLSRVGDYRDEMLTQAC